MKTHLRAASALLVALPMFAAAEENADPIDEIIVVDHATEAAEIRLENEALLDTAVALKSIPGANVNSNGLVTGIAQYRGMYGDRVAVTIDSHGMVTGGPNAMDAPLSYVSPMITEALVVERGIASVSSAPESIGGHLDARLARGDFGDGDFELSGFAGSRYSGNGNLSTTAGRLTLANSSHRISAIAELDSGNNISTPAGEIRPSLVDRSRYDVSYSYANGDNHFVVHAGKLDTDDSGTAALPMDIRYIDTDLIGSHFQYSLTPTMLIEGRVSASDVEHLMDNFSLRSAPPAMRQRQTVATGTGQTVALAGKLDLEGSALRFGIEHTDAEHDAVITNPNNSIFRVINFADVERDLTSMFGEWLIERDSRAIEFGVSLKRVTTDAGDVGAMGMMSPAVAALSDAFNSADRGLSFDDVDAVAKYRYRASYDLEWSVEVARKSRAPSYQELYLWLPMQATGGLADGRTYIGDLDLDSEHSNELSVGISSSYGRLNLSPQLFYKKVDGFIQGVPASNDGANMVAMMMGGQPALQFSNTDAEIWGFDMAWSLRMSEKLSVDGVATYTRGRRTDVSDNLYRLVPPNARVGVTYSDESWVFNTEVVAYGSQKNVSAFNNEQSTAGYEILNGSVAWMPSPSLRLEARVDNLFDATYQEHLAGINRAGGSDIAVGSRFYGAERTLGAGIIYSF
jgi:iron complex outermembrane receptor protein